LHGAHATLPFGENGGSKRKGEAIREGDHPACTSPASKALFKKMPGAEGWGNPVRTLVRARGRAPEKRF